MKGSASSPRHGNMKTILAYARLLGRQFFRVFQGTGIAKVQTFGSGSCKVVRRSGDRESGRDGVLQSLCRNCAFWRLPCRSSIGHARGGWRHGLDEFYWNDWLYRVSSSNLRKTKGSWTDATLLVLRLGDRSIARVRGWNQLFPSSRVFGTF